MRSNTPERVAAELAEREAALLAEGHTVVGGATAAPAPADPAQPVVDLSHLMERPEVQALVSEAVTRSVATIVAELEAKRGGAAAPAAFQADRHFAEHLAVSIAELIDQGRPGAKRHVAPEVMARHAKSRAAMQAAILDARGRGILPEYESRGPSYLSEQLVRPIWIGADHRERPTRFTWPGVPNQAMHPVNDAAIEIYRHFADSIGLLPPPKPTEPLIAGFGVIQRQDDAPETGHGRGAIAKGGVQMRDREVRGTIPEPMHILGSVAEPARSTVG